ncbi:MAG: DUF3276 family protein [Flavisolibacter sp.]
MKKHNYICIHSKPKHLLTVKITKVGYDNNDKKMESIYSKRIRAGKRRTYFFDVRATRGNDYYLTITESRKRFNDNGYDRHKIFLYKEDFNKFIKALTEAVDHVKTQLMPDFDFDAYNHEESDMEHDGEEVMMSSNGSEVEIPVQVTEPVESQASAPGASEEVDKW